jgi:hypothetical protein
MLFTLNTDPIHKLGMTQKIFAEGYGIKVLVKITLKYITVVWVSTLALPSP